MNILHFSAAPLAAESIDTVNGIIRSVSVISSGIIAKGHDLAVDETTLAQMYASACRKGGQIPVKVDHKSGAAAVCGYLTNFRQRGGKLKADWHLLQSHPQREQILEVALRMPRGVGLSASFISPEIPDRTHDGKPAARCEELISVDYVTLPAANPDGLFAARAASERPLAGPERVHRVIAAAGRGAETGALTGVAARVVLRRRGIRVGDAATAGAMAGAVANGFHQYRKDRPHNLAARVATILFQRRAAISRLIDATRDSVSVPIPGTDNVRNAAKPIVRRVAIRAAKIAVGAGAGFYAGRKFGGKVGAITGAVGGFLLEDADVRRVVCLSLKHAKHVCNL